jgi:aryl-alcohol dehydrogenase-like predicted oxidoreductase
MNASSNYPTDFSLFTFPDGLTVHRMGFGAMRLTGPGIWGEPDDPQEARSVLKRALQLGVNFIDTADAYGPEVSERLIAEALYPYPEDLVIATKGGLVRGRVHDWYPDGRPAHLRQALEDSLRRLRLERIDLYQLHAPDPKVPLEESLGALADLQREGKIRHLGVSNVSLQQLHQAQKVIAVASVQNRYNLADRDSEKVLQACERQGIAFIPWYPLGTGELTGPGNHRSAVAWECNGTPAQVALAWLLRHSPVMLPIPGTANVRHLEENVAAARMRLTDDEYQRLLEDA